MWPPKYKVLGYVQGASCPMETRWGPSALWSVLSDTQLLEFVHGRATRRENETRLSHKELEMFHLAENGIRGDCGPHLPLR